MTSLLATKVNGISDFKEGRVNGKDSSQEFNQSKRTKCLFKQAVELTKDTYH